MPPSAGAAPARGIVSQPSKYMIRAQQRSVGSLVWAEHKRDMWFLCEVESQDNTLLRVKNQATGKREEIDLGFGEVYEHNPKVVSDMTALHHIHEAGILHNLGERAQLKAQRPYTFMGTILIAVNPLRKVEDPSMDDYMNRPLNPETPHPYAIAELAYHQMRLGAGRKVADQSIVVSGESGAGKTETSKIILRFLTHRSVGGITGLEQKVVDSSPILESFGNAKTLRNNNSSRFGKFLKMQFTRDKYRLAGAFVETYLLEKSRVLSPGHGERNFHILYELVAGAAKCGLAKDLKLKGVSAYRILSSSGCTTLEGVDDAEQFEAVRAACRTIGMDEGTQMQVWKALAAVLHMSNVAFNGKDDEQGEVAAIKDSVGLEALSALVGVDAGLVETMLTRKEVKAAGEVFTKKLGVDDANLTRDAIVKSLYEALFLWIVRVINTSLGKGEPSLPFIGVLDIFGFENFEHSNEFEQLLINFTNESLQDTFNKQVFNNEIKLYEAEGIEVTVSSCPDNAECLQMLTEKPSGVIPGLDTVCSEPKPSDARYLEKLHKTYARHQHFPRTKPKDMRDSFSVKHYAGTVKYTVDGWVSRNMDNIPQAFCASLNSSTHKVVREMVQAYGAAAPTAVGGAGGRTRGQAIARPTVSKGFLASMRNLNNTLLGTTCNFVRCIKPNADMECGVYDNSYVVEQLQCLGILQTCEVLKVGMPTRVTYSELKEVLGDKAAEADKLFKGEPETALIASILWAFEVPSESFRLGKTRVFFRAGQISTLQRILNETTPDKAPWIFKRLQEALANRHRAKAAAEEAQAGISAAEDAVKKAEDASAKVLGAAVESDDDDRLVQKPARSSSVCGVSDGDLHPLESVAKVARTAGSTAPQIEAMIGAAKEDKMGTYATGAMDRLLAGSRESLALIKDASDKAAALQVEIAEVRGRDEATELRRLTDMRRQMRLDIKVARDMTESAVEAAAKCQVEKTRELTGTATAKSSAVESQARAVTGVASSAAQVSVRQQEAFAKAKALAIEVAAAGEKARAAFSSFRGMLESANAEEEAARVEQLAASDREAAERRRAQEEAAAAKAKAKAEAAQAAPKETTTAPATPTVRQAEEEDELSELVTASEAPVNRRASAIARTPSMSVKNLLDSDMAKSPVPSPSIPTPKEDDAGKFPSVEVDDGPRAGGPQMPQRSATERFEEAMEDGFMEGPLMTQKGMMKSWTHRYFVLENGFLTHYEKRSLVGTKKHKTMELTAHSVTQRTNKVNFFGVRTGPKYMDDGDTLSARGRTKLGNKIGKPESKKKATEWIMLARSKKEMEDWMAAINDQIHALFIREYGVPEDDYRSLGTTGQFFYKMAASAKPQWIRTFPLAEAPRTGDGLFEGEVIEVTQVLTHNDVKFLRMANDRGWTFASDVEGGSGGQLFTKIFGEVVDDSRPHIVPQIAAIPATVRCGPSMDSQETGAIIMPGKKVQVLQRFTPSEGVGQGETGMSFMKLKGRKGGWVPVMTGTANVGVVPFNARGM